jgi:hypothetical protein
LPHKGERGVEKRRRSAFRRRSKTWIVDVGLDWKSYTNHVVKRFFDKNVVRASACDLDKLNTAARRRTERDPALFIRTRVILREALHHA